MQVPKKIIGWTYQIMTPETLKGFFGYPELSAVGKGYAKVFKMDYTPVPLEDTVKSFREANMMCMVPAIDNETMFGNKTEPAYVADLVQKYPDTFYGFAGADPHKGYQAAVELERQVKQYGFKAVYLQPMETGVPIDDRRHYPIYTKAMDLGIMVLVAVSVHYNLSIPIEVQHPYGVDHVAIDFPDLKIVCRHGLFPWIWELVAVMQRHANVYLEISSFRHRYIHPEWLRYIDSQFRERVVYGCGSPAITPKQNVEEFMSLPLRDDTKQNILYNTSARLLGFSE